METLTLSIRRKLVLVVWTVLIMITLITGLSYLGLNCLSIVRAYIGAESLWSKSEKNALTALQRYVQIQFSRNQVSSDLTMSVRSVQIAQVLLNLLNNASDAVTGKPNPWIRLDVFEKNEFVEIRITDSGSGIPLAIQEKMFQPFFTTKEIGLPLEKAS